MATPTDHFCTPPKRGGTNGARWTCPTCGAKFRFKSGGGAGAGALRKRLTGSWFQTKG